MDTIVEIWGYLANKLNNECLANEILSFSVNMTCNFDYVENFASYSFMISFPGLEVQLQNNWKTQIENCLSMKFICNLNVSSMEFGNEGAIVIANGLKMNANIQKRNLNNNQISAEGAIAIANVLKKILLFKK